MSNISSGKRPAEANKENSTKASAPNKKQALALDNEGPEDALLKLQPHLKKANKQEVENLAKDLFRELWNQKNGKTIALKAVAPFWKSIQSSEITNLQVEGEWRLKLSDGKEGKLIIDWLQNSKRWLL